MELKICRGALGISHLLFVNNTLVFLKKLKSLKIVFWTRVHIVQCRHSKCGQQWRLMVLLSVARLRRRWSCGESE
jgi:hypothetical protein